MMILVHIRPWISNIIFRAVDDYFCNTVHSYKYNFYVVLGYSSKNVFCSFLTELALALYQLLLTITSTNFNGFLKNTWVLDLSWNFLQDSPDPIFVGQRVQKLCPNSWIIHLWKSWLVNYNLFSWDIGLFRFLDLTFEPLDLQKSGQENLAENFKTSPDLMYLLKIH